MQTHLQPIKLYGKGGPNPPKVAIILEELQLPYEIISIPFSDVKKPEYTAINPNGRLPSIHDPNTGLTLWESGAIIEYLVEKYDTVHSISFAQGTHEYYLARQWNIFQASGQGPYFGQAAWYSGKVGKEPKIQGPFDRYIGEVNRVVGVLEAFLTKREKEEGPAKAGRDGPWLVSDRCSYADLCFLQWQLVSDLFFDKEVYDVAKYPHVKAWLDKMAAREGVKVALEKTQGH